MYIVPMCRSKYADDGYLLIGSSLIQTAGEEVDNISRWAKSNNLRLNHSKTRVMLVSKKVKLDFPHLKQFKPRCLREQW